MLTRGLVVRIQLSHCCGQGLIPGQGKLFSWASQVALVVKNPPASAGDIRNMGSVPGLGRSSGEGSGQPTPVFLPGESLGQRSLVGYSP